MSGREHTLADDEGGVRELRWLWLWVFIVVLYFAWEAAAYRGLYATLSEWEFDRLGQDLPTFNFTVLTMMLAWPAFALLGRLRDRRLRQQDENQAIDPLSPSLEDDEVAIAAFAAQEKRHAHRLAMITSRDYMHFLFAFTCALWFAALMILLWAQSLPDRTDHPKHYTPASLYGDRPREGAAKLEGTLHYGRISSFSRGVLFARHTALYAPLIPPAGTDGHIRYFIEFLPAERPDIHSGGVVNHRDGVLVRSDLPGALIRLYRYLGYRPARDYHVLYVSPFTLEWPYLVIAAQFMIGGLLFFLSAFWQRFHMRALTRKIAHEVATESRPVYLPQYQRPRHVWWEEA